ncbi:MAG: M6 family metalloprotease domain-containing protein [Candidatus Cloacimonetes bacterium]|nr:M6 family metalloprotease domain-containing protein [Candidatus Cloacimonadota bacterium]
MKPKYILVLIMLLAGVLFAAPLRMTPVSYTQPDGSAVNMFASGDEFHNWLHDASDYTIMQDDAGWYVYARQDGEGVAPTDLVVERDTPNMRNLSPGINLSEGRIAAKYARYQNTMRDYSNSKSPHTGQFNNIVIFIRFSDDPVFNSPITFYDGIFNTTGDYANSMKHYFESVSYGQLNVDTSFYPAPQGNTVISYVDTQPRNYFRIQSGSNPIGYPANDDGERATREMQMLARAVAAVGNQVPASLDVDGDNDGYVDNTCFIIQGSPDGWAELLWPHRWVLYGANATINGAQVWDFNFQLANSLASSGAGVLSHEMFHSLGAPDLYRYTTTNISPVGGWDIMSNDQNPPQHMGAWMKHRYGQWLPQPPMITASGTYSLSPLASSATNNVYRIASWKANESYLLEYRKPDIYYDDNLPGTGLLVYRLDARENGNAQGPPDELYIYRPLANNTNTQGYLSNAAFSADNGRTVMSERTVPSGFLGNNAAGGLNIYNIGYEGDTITFSVTISDIQIIAPIGGEAWFSGLSKDVLWKAKATTGSVKIEFSDNMGDTWSLVVASTPNDGSYTWTTIPIISSQQCLMRITLLSNNQSDTSVSAFTVLSYLNAPDGVYPVNMVTDAPTNPVISWQSVLGASSYEFQLSTDPEFNSFVVNVFEHPGTSYQASFLSPNTTYYWRVASIAEIGISPFCETLSFTTGSISEYPVIPQLNSPANYSVNLSTNPTFVWTPSLLALSYRLQVASDPYYQNVELDVSQLEQTSYTANNLPYNTLLYWRIASANQYGNSNFSVSWRFTTALASPSEDELNPVLHNELKTNYPNPFNPHTTISFNLKDISKAVKLSIYNTRGQLVRKLFNDTPSSHRLSLVWDGNDDFNMPVSSGVYLYRLESADYRETRKMLLAK